MDANNPFPNPMDKNILHRAASIGIVIVLAFILDYVLFTKQAKAPASSAPTLEKEWIKSMIMDFENQPVSNPPLSVTQCLYKDQVVYYVPPHCCDFPGIVYGTDGTELCESNGGLSGDSNGKCPNFLAAKKDCKTVWQDSRQYPNSVR
jgi:hypothetical protein